MLRRLTPQCHSQAIFTDGSYKEWRGRAAAAVRLIVTSVIVRAWDWEPQPSNQLPKSSVITQILSGHSPEPSTSQTETLPGSLLHFLLAQRNYNPLYRPLPPAEKGNANTSH
ncbi:hypothetical protein PtB15_17B129 [Puccinia triticina]|nr:hypothetical protein PtB15_17B129 [Puccinia triticina]